MCVNKFQFLISELKRFMCFRVVLQTQINSDHVVYASFQQVVDCIQLRW